MRVKRAKIAGGVVLLASAVFALVLVISQPSVPKSGVTVRGRPLEDWVANLLRSYDYTAAEAIRETGTNALPLLREALARRSTRANTLWVKVWPQLPAPLQKRFPQPVLAREARMNTIALLREMPEQSKTILPDLLARLSDDDAQIRLHTAITMGNIGPDAKAAIPTLLEFTKSDSHVVRVYSANALWKVSGEVEPALSVLEAGLQEKGARFRWGAPVFLGEMGDKAARSLPLLAEASRDSDKDVASLAIQAIAKISEDSVPILVEQLSSDDPAVRISAATALGGLGPKAVKSVPALQRLTNDVASGAPAIMGRPMGNEKVSDAARDALRRIGAN